MTTRRELLLLLRTRPGITATEAADALSLTGAAIRRHLDQLLCDGLVERAPVVAPEVGHLGRPPTRWKLSSAGLELFPRGYDGFALDLLDDLAEEGGPEAVAAVLARRTAKVAADYREQLEGLTSFEDRVRRVAELRDEAGYAAECRPGEDGALLLVERNCALHRIAERHGGVCSMEQALLESVMGPEHEVTRVSHTMAGDPVCCYRIRPRHTEGGRL